MNDTNASTHPDAALSEAFTPTLSRRLLDRVKAAGRRPADLDTATTPADPVIAPVGEPATPVKLDPDDLACQDCGLGVRGPFTRDQIVYAETAAFAFPNGALSAVPVGRDEAEPMTTCTACASRQNLSRLLTAKHLPRGLVIDDTRLSIEVTVERINEALAGLELIGKPLPTVETTDRHALEILCDRLADVAGFMFWQRRFAPVKMSFAVSGTGNLERFAHIRETDRVDVRAGYAETLAARLARLLPPATVRPPSLAAMGEPVHGGLHVDTGCLICGVDQITISPEQVALSGGHPLEPLTVWTYQPPRSVQSLGGKGSLLKVSGSTCPACTRQVAETYSLTVTTIESALLAHLGISGAYLDEGLQLDGPIAYAVAVADAARREKPAPPAPKTRFGHLGNLTKLADQIRGAW